MCNCWLLLFFERTSFSKLLLLFRLKNVITFFQIVSLSPPPTVGPNHKCCAMNILGPKYLTAVFRKLMGPRYSHVNRNFVCYFIIRRRTNIKKKILLVIIVLDLLCVKSLSLELLVYTGRIWIIILELFQTYFRTY